MFCAFLSKALHEVHRNEMKDIPVPATREEKSSEMVTFFILRLSKDLENKGILRKNNSRNELDNPYVTG